MDHSADSEKHIFSTRLVHAGLAIAIVTNLMLSLVMDADSDDQFFHIHEYVGLAAFVFAFAFWIIVFARKRGTAIGLLFPWFSVKRMKALIVDIKAHVVAGLKFKLPAYEDDSALPSAVHGLGLLLMSVMAVTGTIFFIGLKFHLFSREIMHFDMLLHHLFANLVWVYLIAHASLGVLHHYLAHFNLGKMWSLRRN